MGLKMIDFPYIFHVNVWKRFQKIGPQTISLLVQSGSVN